MKLYTCEQEMLEKAWRDRDRYEDEEREKLESRFADLTEDLQIDVCIQVANNERCFEDAISYAEQYGHTYHLEYEYELDAELAWNLVDSFIPELRSIQSKDGRVYLDEVIDYFRLMEYFEIKSYVKSWELPNRKTVYYW